MEDCIYRALLSLQMKFYVTPRRNCPHNLEGLTEIHNKTILYILFELKPQKLELKIFMLNVWHHLRFFMSLESFFIFFASLYMTNNVMCDSISEFNF